MNQQTLIWFCILILFGLVCSIPPENNPDLSSDVEQIHIPIESLLEISNLNLCAIANVSTLRSGCELGYDNVYLGVNSTVQIQDAYASQVASIGSVAPNDCRQVANPFACATLFRQCIELAFQYNSTTSYKVRPFQPVCRSMCRAVVNTCPAVLLEAASTAFPFLQPSCIVPFSLPWPGVSRNLTMFPEKGWNFTLIDASGAPLQNYYIHCKSNVTEAFSPSAPVMCMYPFIPVKNPGNGPLCDLPCPDPSFTEQEYKNVKIVSGVTGWISFILTVFISLSYFIDPTRRSFPRNLPMMVFISSSIISLGIILPSMATYEKVWCNDQPTGLNHASSTCIFQGILLMYGALSACFWWLSISIHLYISISYRAAVELKAWHFYSACFGIPIPLVIIALAANKISYFNSSTICFVNVDDNSMWQYGLFYIPIMITLLFGVPLMIVIMYKVWQVTKESKTFPASTQVRIGVFLLLYTYIWIFFIIYRFVATKKQGEIQKAFVDWVLCKVQRPTANCTLSDRMDYGLWLTYAFNAGVQGILIALPFGSDLSIYRRWTGTLSYLKSKSSNQPPSNPTVL